MGHNRLGTLPRTQRWRDVIKLLEEEADLSQIADASIEAAQSGLQKVPNDLGFTITLTDIFQFIESARSKDLVNTLWERGFPVPEKTTLFDLISSLRQKTDVDLTTNKARSDISEIAQNAFSEVLLKHASTQLPSLFEIEAEAE